MFRSLAGIWPYWKGRLRLPKGARLLFLPQKPYLPIGTLKHAVAYPDDPAKYSDPDVGEALAAVGLANLGSDLERNENWAWPRLVRTVADAGSSAPVPPAVNVTGVPSSTG